MAISNYLINEIGTQLFFTGSWTKPSELWVSLYTTLPDADDAGGVEVTGGSYARSQLDPLDANWEFAAGYFTNSVPINFPAPTADWGTVVGYGLRDASTAGNLLFFHVLVGDLPILNGEPAPFFKAGDLSIGIV